ncbi:MAG: hypothetical protein M1819_005282 [Sarea resinae]|nr:MAG: hypothetical protein M1819_005282 [Sarea resinae]
MSSTVSHDGSEDVNDFLQRIRELGDKRDKEDEERTRKLEEEILQGRKERQARRAERARSISPTKDSPSNVGTPQSLGSPFDTPSQDKVTKSAMDARPSSSQSLSRDADVKSTLDRLTGTPSAEDGTHSKKTPTRDTTPADSFIASPSARNTPPALSRTGALSWQRRPNSQASSGVRPRPASTVAVEKASSRSTSPALQATSVSESDDTTNQIRKSLASKDPSWFRQTPDRGASSAAYRRSEDPPLSSMAAEGRLRLPGMSRESTPESQAESVSPSDNTSSSSRVASTNSIRGSAGWTNRYSSTSSQSTMSGIEKRSALPISSSQKFEPPSSDATTNHGTDQSSTGRTLAMSPAQGRISPERPTSPTKGLGGFVQSAMLKRSDSVNKRWSAQAGSGLSRGNSITSNRSGYSGSRDGLAGLVGPMTSNINESRGSSLSRETSPHPNSRPGSSHSSATVKQDPKETEKSNDKSTTSEVSEEKLNSISDADFVKPALPQHTRTRSVATAEGKTHPHSTPPASPTKTYESKRWSPTKASWLESALNKPDLPKPKAAPPQQPSWMAEINKAKQSRASVDLGKGATGIHDINTGGLTRASAPGVPSKPLSMTRLPSLTSSELQKPDVFGGNDGLEKAKESDSRPVSHAISGESSIVTPKDATEEVIAQGSVEENKSLVGEHVRDRPLSSSVEVPVPNRSSTSLVADKAKPETPPKKDFRSALKPRQVIAENDKAEEPEFKNVFGKLKRTQTKNYVAPDELKDNILRGKAGLAATGGPKKTERKDEFRESILKRKEAMKSKAADEKPTTSITSSSAGVARDGPPTPEAIAKRKNLGRSNSIVSGVSNDPQDKRSNTPEDVSEQRSDNSTSISSEAQSRALGSVRSAEQSARNKLADRFNPALAGLLARGPSPISSSSGAARTTTPINTTGASSSQAKESHEDEKTATQLTHMTKARARGPKRRLPTSADRSTLSPSAAVSETTTFAKDVITESTKTPLNPVRPQPQDSSEGFSGPSTPIQATPIKARPSPPVKSPLLTQKDAVKVAQSSPMASPRRFISSQKPLPDVPGKPTSKSGTADDEKLENLARSGPPSTPRKDTDEAGDRASVKDVTALWGRQGRAGTPLQSSTMAPTKKAENSAMEGIEPSKPPTERQEIAGLGVSGVRSTSTPSKVLTPIDRNLPSSPGDPRKPSAVNRELPPIPPLATTVKGISNGVQSANMTPGSPIPHTSEANRLFSDFFGEDLHSLGTVEVDTQAILSSRSDGNEKIKTLRKEIWEITGDGKKMTVPSHREHILFEDSMYICIHVFGTPNGTRASELYQWIGDNVPDSAVEDAQLFSRKVARENNSKLITIRQGKETANFFQALGGIVIIRRGPSSRADSSGPYMLLGRRHLGQIAFDEIDLSLDRLCSGFPYIISTGSGKTILWKGKGSGADELGCARLIGMDLGSGEIEEIDEGHEPPAFFDAFPATSKRAVPKSADHWRLKASYDNYSCRLFCIGQDAGAKVSSFWPRRPWVPDSSPPAQVREISPFSQRDLQVESVYVVDAFFEIYM